jgi:hypothetical protein
MKRLAVLLIIAMTLCSAAMSVENLKAGGLIESRGWWWSPDKSNDSKYMENEVYLWVNGDLADNIFTRVNLKYHGDFGTAPSSDGNTNGNIDLWEGYVQFSKMWDTTISTRLGRWMAQIPDPLTGTYIPKYGEGFLVPNNRPYDGMRTSISFEPTEFDVFWIKLLESTRNKNDDISAYGFYITNKSFECTELNLYGAYVDQQHLYSGYPSKHIYVLGARAVGQAFCVPGLTYKAEMAYTQYEFDRNIVYNVDKVGDSFGGVGGYIGANYVFDQPIKPSVRANFYYFNEKFIQPIGHVDQDDLGEKGYGRIADAYSNLTSNVWFINIGGSAYASRQMKFDADLYYYQQVKGTDIDSSPFVSNEKKKLGTELDLMMTYYYTKDVATEIVAAYFSPEDEELSTYRGTPSSDTWLLKASMRVRF